MLVFEICPNFIIQIYQPFILYWYWWCFQTPLQPLQWENTNCGRWVELCGAFGSFIWSVYVSALVSRMWHCSSSRHHGAMVDCLYQWQGSIVTADCVTCCGQVPVMMVTSATGASADLLRHEKNIINIYRVAGDHLPHRSSH